MTRRTLSAIVLLSLLVGLSSAMSGSGCLCTSDQPCWPTAATFSHFQSQLSQPLVYPHPTAFPCYPPSHPSGNCTDVNVNFNDGNWRASHPGSLESANYETYIFPNGTVEACFLNTSITGTCGQGQVPVIGADVRSVADVQAVIRFAVEHSLKLAIKNTGHDFAGRSTARGAFLVWTHNMKNITYSTAFVPQGAPPGSETYEAITLGAGVQWYEAYSEANKHGRMVVGGAEGSIGAAGGWLSGGGHSFLSPSYGLGVDNTLEISVVLSTGEYLTTNKYQNSDLFWALRGGGGSTYGIVTSVTYRTYPVVPIQGWSFQANVTNPSILPQLVEGFLHYQIQFTDDGWGGYGAISNQSVNFNFVAPNMTNETVKATTQPWLNFIQSLGPGVVSSSKVDHSSWGDLISALLIPGAGGGGSVIISSRLLSRDTINSNYSRVAQWLIERGSGFNMIGGGRVNQIDADSAGLNPAWRNAIVELTYGVSIEETTSSAEIQRSIQQLRDQIQTMYDITPNDGAYLNEASPYEVEWQKAFFGAHYPKLKKIKNKYDPNRLFVITEGVGSEDWDESLTCR